MYPANSKLSAGFVTLTAIAAALGIASPGIRTPSNLKLLVVGFLAVGIASSSSGCAWFKSNSAKLVDCTEQAIARQLPALVPEVSKALNGDALDYDGDMNRVILAAGDAGVCALQLVIATIESGKGGAGAGFDARAGFGPPDSVKLLRAYSWLQAHPTRTH
jgi:hypothetical protein